MLPYLWIAHLGHAFDLALQIPVHHRHDLIVRGEMKGLIYRMQKGKQRVIAKFVHALSNQFVATPYSDR